MQIHIVFKLLFEIVQPLHLLKYFLAIYRQLICTNNIFIVNDILSY